MQLYFAGSSSSIPASTMENLTLWNHHESGTMKCATQAQPFDAQLQEDDLSMNDWRFESLPDSRQIIANKIVIALRKHRLPISGQEELRKFVMGFEENIFAAATSKTDYLRKISLKMLSLTMETKFQIHVCDETVQVDEDDLNDRYTQLENKEKEMMAQLEAIRKEKNEITKRRSHSSV
ncbi:hypothetical protein R3W88_025712 [Solanum pinnatisectum]|uniref:Mediator complex subunit 15 KIX domain-containing protein n=1 Tax=Solanum pinnatisectum TaxID=50273 RepID=A0AAV9M778_9SOLN|nr:hypothetical protein R3W88_025712 [Solanum pinnatisectum]